MATQESYSEGMFETDNPQGVLTTLIFKSFVQLSPQKKDVHLCMGK